MKNQVSSIKNPRKRANRKGQGRKISYPQDLEDKLVAWILEKREAEFVAVSTQMIRLKALSLIKDTNPKFKASDGWVRKFMKRNDLVLRVRTHISQKLPSDLESKIKNFRDEVSNIHKNSDYPFEYICNMDETPVYLDLVPNKVVDKKGKKSIRVRTTSSEKNRITATLCCTAAGKFLPAFVVFKGKTQRPLKKVKIPSGVVTTTQVKGWMDEVRMLEWIKKVWSPYISGKPALLALDTFSGHLTDKVRNAFSKCNTKLLVIPGGCTSVLQPLDLSINKPFKNHIRDMWCQYMVAEADKGVSKIKPPPKSNLLEWIKAAQEKIESKGTIVKKSFMVAGITNSETEMVRSDEVYQEVQKMMEDIFGDTHVGYVDGEDPDDPFADLSDNESGEDPDDPFADQSDDESGEDPDDPSADRSEDESGEDPDDPFADQSDDKTVSSEGVIDSENDAMDQDEIQCDLTIEDLTNSSKDDSD